MSESSFSKEQMQTTIESQRMHILTLQADNAKLREGLKRLEWCLIGEWCGVSGHPRNFHSSRIDEHWMACPVCGNHKCAGHKPDCWLAELLR